MMELPSQVEDPMRRYLRVPDAEKVVDSYEEWKKCGKWILVNRSGTMKWLDRAWVALQSLVKDGFLLMLKSSTAADQGNAGVIICFTRPEKEVIRVAAEEIRKRLHYDHSIYYKVNGLTEEGVNVQFGDSNFCLYMHTPKGRFYEKRVGSGCWIWKLDEASQSDKPVESSKNIEKLIDFCSLDVVDQLPSRALKLKTKLDLISKRPFNGKNYFYISAYCNLDQEDGGLSEADRLWIVGKKILQDNAARRIECMKMKKRPCSKMIGLLQSAGLLQLARIQFHVSSAVNVSLLVQRISKMAKYTGFFYGPSARYSFDGEMESKKFV